jgi:hypothetical protein
MNAETKTPKLYEDTAPEIVWLVSREVHIPQRWNVSSLDHGDEYLTYVRSDAASELEQRARFYQKDAATAWDKCEERRMECLGLEGLVADMLAALKGIEAALRKDSRDKTVLRDTVEYHLDGQAMYGAINAAREAIAKAEGRTP